MAKVLVTATQLLYEPKVYARFNSTFLKIINTFNQLDKRGRELSKPLRIKKYIVKEGDTYRDLAEQSKIHYNSEDQLRLLNGDFPNQTRQPTLTNSSILAIAAQLIKGILFFSGNIISTSTPRRAASRKPAEIVSSGKK